MVGLPKLKYCLFGATVNLCFMHGWFVNTQLLSVCDCYYVFQAWVVCHCPYTVCLVRLLICVSGVVVFVNAQILSVWCDCEFMFQEWLVWSMPRYCLFGATVSLSYRSGWFVNAQILSV